MRRWSRERKRWPVEPFCHDWKRQWALTSVGGFRLSSCLLVRPCGIRESKMNTLTHFPPFPPSAPFLPLSTPSPLTLFFACSMTCMVNRNRDHFVYVYKCVFVCLRSEFCNLVYYYQFSSASALWVFGLSHLIFGFAWEGCFILYL